MPFTPENPDAQYFCTGTTELLYQMDSATFELIDPVPSDPTAVDISEDGSGPVIDFTKVFGERLADLEAGKTIPLYTNQADQSQNPPACSMRLETHQVTGQTFAVTEWSYWSQRDNPACILTDAEGRVHMGNDLTGAQEAVESDAAGLSADQQLVRCVTDMYEQKPNYSPEAVAWCNDLGLGPDGDRFTLMVDAGEAKANLGLTRADGATVEADTPFTVTVAANKHGIPIELATSSSATLTLVDPAEGTLNENVLVLAEGVETADLLVSGAAVGAFELSADMLAPNGINVAWSQSPTEPSGGKACQVSAATSTAETTALSGRIAVEIAEAPDAGSDNSGSEGVGDVDGPQGSGGAAADGTTSVGGSNGNHGNLAETGSSGSWAPVAAAALIAVGAAAVLTARARVKAARNAA